MKIGPSVAPGGLFHGIRCPMVATATLDPCIRYLAPSQLQKPFHVAMTAVRDIFHGLVPENMQNIAGAG
jgi:hypothetical protein